MKQLQLYNLQVIALKHETDCRRLVLIPVSIFICNSMNIHLYEEQFFVDVVKNIYF